MGLEHLNRILNDFFTDAVQLRQPEKSEALEYCRPIVYAVVGYVKLTGGALFEGIRILGTGSYYEGTKAQEPDEFDYMLILEDVDHEEALADVLQFYILGKPTGFTRLVSDDLEFLNAVEFRTTLARLVRDAIIFLELERTVEVKYQGPAVTLQILNPDNGREYSVDLTIAIRYKKWPREANEWISRPRKGWPSREVVEKICRRGCYVVPKQPRGDDISEHDRQYLWRFSFSEAEKELFLMNGHHKRGSCRKQVLRILKALRPFLQLKSLKSYHLKTMLLYECEEKPYPIQWSSDQLSNRFLGLLQRLEVCLRQVSCPHYFMQDFDLFAILDPVKCAKTANIVANIRSRFIEMTADEEEEDDDEDDQVEDEEEEDDDEDDQIEDEEEEDDDEHDQGEDEEEEDDDEDDQVEDEEEEDDDEDDQIEDEEEENDQDKQEEDEYEVDDDEDDQVEDEEEEDDDEDDQVEAEEEENDQDKQEEDEYEVDDDEDDQQEDDGNEDDAPSFPWYPNLVSSAPSSSFSFLNRLPYDRFRRRFARSCRPRVRRLQTRK